MTIKALHIRTSKTASSTINNWCGKDILSTFNQGFLQDAPNKPQIDEAIENNYYLFTSVRNPFTRAVSCYYQCIRSGWIVPDWNFKQYLKWDMKGVGSHHTITHNMPQAEYLKPYYKHINKVVRVENIKQDLRDIEKTLGLKNRPVKWFNPNEWPNQVPYRNLYDDEAKELVLEKYAVDFDTFDYVKIIDF